MRVDSGILRVALSPGRFSLLKAPLQVRPAGWARLRVLSCGVCGTDLHLLHGMRLPTGASYPVYPGHEVAAEVLEADPGCGPQAGARVVLHPLLPCGRCPACTSGRENLCESGEMLGIHRAGGLAEEMLWRSDRLVPAGDLDPSQAALLPDAVATAFHALSQARLSRNSKLAVIGAGGVGTNVLQISRAIDPDVQLVGVVYSEGTARRIQNLGIPVVQGLEGAGRAVRAQFGEMDAVVDFSGAAGAPSEAIRMLKKGGRLILGSVRDEQVALTTTFTGLMTRETEIIGSCSSTLADLQAVTQLVSSGKLSLDGLISHSFQLKDAEQAFDVLGKRPSGMVRVVVQA